MRDGGPRSERRLAAEREGREALAAIEDRVRERVDAHRLEHELSAALHEHGRPAREERPLRISDLERHVRAWRDAVPHDPHARAALARLVADRHPRGLAAADGARGALGVDDGEVRRAHDALYGEPLHRLLAHAAGPVTRLRLAVAGLGRSVDTLPPVLVFAALVVGICLPQAILGLPIVAATAGPLPAVAVLAVIGALLTVALAAETESMARSGPFRSGAAFLGRLSDQFLGTRASAITTPVAAARTALSALAAYIGLALSLASLTGLPRSVFSVATFAALALLLLRGGIRITVGAGAFVGLVSSVLLLVIAAIAVAHIDGDALLRADVPLLGGEGSVAAALGPLIALALLFYIGNVYVIGVAKRMLPHDPGGSVSLRGTVLGMVALVVLGAVWLVPVTAAVPAADLAGERGTALGPLSDVTGPVVGVLGTLATLLLLGLGLERTAVALVRFTDERLPDGFGATGRRRRLSARTLACAVPALGMCAIGEVLLALGDVSFSNVMGLAGVISNIVVSGPSRCCSCSAPAGAASCGRRAPSGSSARPPSWPRPPRSTRCCSWRSRWSSSTPPPQRVAAGAAALALAAVLWRHPSRRRVPAASGPRAHPARRPPADGGRASGGARARRGGQRGRGPRARGRRRGPGRGAPALALPPPARAAARRRPRGLARPGAAGRRVPAGAGTDAARRRRRAAPRGHARGDRPAGRRARLGGRARGRGRRRGAPRRPGRAGARLTPGAGCGGRRTPVACPSSSSSSCARRAASRGC